MIFSGVLVLPQPVQLTARVARRAGKIKPDIMCDVFIMKDISLVLLK